MIELPEIAQLKIIKLAASVTEHKEPQNIAEY